MTIKRQCGTMPLHFEAVKAERGYADTRRMDEILVSSFRVAPLTSTVRIPVVVHIVAAYPEHEVTDEQVREQIAVLTKDFRAQNLDIQSVPKVFQDLIADIGVEFHLATRDPAGRPTNGIVKKRTNIRQFPQAMAPNEELSTSIAQELMLGDTGSVAWPAESYLNIWVCNMGRRPLGFAAFPGSPSWRDGVVVDYRCFGSSGTAESPFNLGRTATHEVGHWLGLLHIWGNDQGTCHQSDNVEDTPNQGGANYNKPEFPSPSCKNEPHGDLYMNYMDYVDDDVMCMFTRGQLIRMHGVLQGRRAGLLVSKGFDKPSNGAETTLRRVLEMNAFNRVSDAGEQYFDGVTWVSAGEGDDT